MLTTDETLWHKCESPLIPRFTVDGKLTAPLGQIWRRRGPSGKWKYKQDPPTLDDIEANAW
jgi:hypothetical protein